MSILAKNLTCDPETINRGTATVKVSFDARMGGAAQKVYFTLTLEDGLPIYIEDPYGSEVKSYSWNQTIGGDWHSYEIDIDFAVNVTPPNRQPVELTLYAKDSGGATSKTIGVIYYK